MNIWFQILLGLSPAIIIFLILTIVGFKKKVKGWLVNLTALVALSIAAVALCLTGFMSNSDEEASFSGQKEINLKLAYAVASEGDFDMAGEMIDVMRTTYAESPELTEFEALIYAAKGDAVSAKALLLKANMIQPKNGYKELISLCDAAMAEGKITMGVDAPEKRSKLIESAFKVIGSKAESKSKVQQVAKVLVEADKIYDDFLLRDELDADKVKKLANFIDLYCDEDSGLSGIKEVRLCKTKLLVLAEKYDKIAEDVNEDYSFDELAIVAELLINNMIDNNDFSEAYAEAFVVPARAVADQLKEIEDEISDADVNKQKELKSLVKNLRISKRNAAVGRLKLELNKHANDESSADRSKAYMQLARMEYEEGNEEEASRNITAALNTVGISDDEKFSEPMVGIVDSITDKENIEKVKNIAQYAEDVTKNSSDYIVVKSIEKAKSEGYKDNEVVGDKDEGGDTEDEKRGPFEAFLADEASQKRNAFSITSVDATDFETVKLVVNVDPSISITEKELKNSIILKDCNVAIEDFEVKKVTYSGADILLCCDISGSMAGQPINDLRNAVKLFAQSSSDIEDIALVTFNSGVSQIYEFGMGKQSIIEAADKIYSGGGTNMYGAVLESIKQFTPADNTLSFILLMSDGADGVSPSFEDIQNNIGAACKEKGIVLFSLGLGDSVNVDYMNTFATSTGGYFVYVNDSATLDDFYTKLRSQILNRYIITYKAKDTLRASRNVTITLKDVTNSSVISDTKQYYLNGTDADVPQGEENQNAIELEGITISGLDTRRVYKNSNSVTVNLLGSKFTDKMSFDIKLDGKLNYENIGYKFVDSETISLTLPGGMACGVYDLVIDVDGKTAIFTGELTVSAMGMEKTTTFGNYVFTSDSRVDSEDGILLSGFVTMNGWLHFNGDVKIDGDLEGYSIRVSDTSGSYIKYYKDSATGLAKSLAEKNVVLNFDPLGSFNIYNDTYSDGESPDHRVDTVPLPMAYIYILEARAPGLELYPDKILVKSDGFTTKFPFQDTLLKAASLDDLYSFDAKLDLMFTNKAIDVNLEVNNKLTEEESNTYSVIPVNFGMLPIYTTPASYEIKINTNTNEYLIDFAVKMAFIDSEGIGLKMEWGERAADKGLQFLVPKTVIFKSDFAIKSTIGTVPVTYRDFNIGVEDIDPNTSFWNWKLVGGFDLETSKLSSYLPALKEFIDDPALFKLDDIKATISLGQAYVSVETEAKFLEEISLGRLKIEAGKIPYTNELLGMKDQMSIGMRAELTAGIIWKTDNIDIDISGTGVLNLHTKFLGLEAKGNAKLSVNWWICEADLFEAKGHALIGFVNNNNRTSFVIKCRETNNKGTTEFFLIVENGDTSYGSKKL